mmetsp:Transcript_28857/g.62785  ORF Transcript_28857/g.62785 Transcript_28857/m.62785 type:complete len:291 (-) Transcript_28857:2623-3495(-)
MCLHLLSTARPKAIARRKLQARLDEVDCAGLNPPRNLDLLHTGHHNVVEHHPCISLYVAFDERRNATNAFVGENTEGPPINHAVITDHHDDLGGDILRRSQKTVRLPQHEFREAQVTELHVSRGVHENILRLQVPKEHVAVVEVGERIGHASKGECVNLGIPEASWLANHVFVQLPSQKWFEEEVQMGFILECRVQLDDEGTVHHAQDLPFVANGFLQVLSHNVSFGHLFHCVTLACNRIVLQCHNAEATTPQDTDSLEALLSAIQDSFPIQLSWSPGNLMFPLARLVHG